MTTSTAFTPTPLAAFQFQAVLDGDQYTVIVTWNVYRGGGTGRDGWYITIQDANGTWIVTKALVASPATYDISLTAGYFSSTMVYREGTGNFEVSP